ncbi:NLP2 [Symbiodinium necroappetens]|uniref:NLP2 protein n=1 Tax=Symbiodinium necroappetens TaxID=1628268 RepID=A0A813CES4_9DINO|nr:NLP2 [Symbiodinium necroappetens]
MSQDQLLKMIRDLQGRVSALEGQRGSESKASRCCSKTTDKGKDDGYCFMADGEAATAVTEPPPPPGAPPANLKPPPPPPGTTLIRDLAVATPVSDVAVPISASKRTVGLAEWPPPSAQAVQQMLERFPQLDGICRGSLMNLPPQFALAILWDMDAKGGPEEIRNPQDFVHSAAQTLLRLPPGAVAGLPMATGPMLAPPAPGMPGQRVSPAMHSVSVVLCRCLQSSLHCEATLRIERTHMPAALPSQKDGECLDRGWSPAAPAVDKDSGWVRESFRLGAAMATLRRMEHQVFAACSTGVRGEPRCAAAAGHADWAQLSAAADFERRAAALKSRREGLLLPGELRAMEVEKEKARLAEERSARRAANASHEAAEAEEEEKRKEVMLSKYASRIWGQAATSGKKTLKVGLCQMTARNDKEANFHTCKQLVTEAASQGCQLVALPECFAFIGAKAGEAQEAAEPLSGPTMGRYAALAKEQQVWLSLGGFQEKVEGEPENKILNTHVILNSEGEMVSVYRKIHLFDAPFTGLVESKQTVPGADVVACDSAVGKLGVTVCYDVRFPQLYQQLRFEHGAEILLIPSAFSMPTGEAHWELLMRTRAVECQCYVIAAAQAGLHNEDGNRRQSWGHAMAVDPWGKVLAEFDGTSSGVKVVEVQPDALEVQAREAGRRRAWEAPELRELRRHYQEVEAEQLRQLQVLRKEVEEETREQEEQVSRVADEVEFLAQERASAHLAAESRARAVQVQKEGEAEVARKTRDQARKAAKEKHQDKMMVQAAVYKAQQQDLQTQTRRRKLQAAVRTALDRLVMEQAQLREQEVRNEEAAIKRAQRQQSAQAFFWAARAQERRAAEQARAQVLERVAACLAQQQEDEQRLQLLHGLLQEEAAAAALRREEERSLERRLEARTKAVQAAEDGLRNLRENRQKEQVEEATWRARFVESCAEEAKLEQLSDQKRRMRLLAFKREAEELAAKRRELRKAEVEKEEADWHLQKLKEEEQSRIVEEERRRLLEVHARGGLLDAAWFSGEVLPKHIQDIDDGWGSCMHWMLEGPSRVRDRCRDRAVDLYPLGVVSPHISAATERFAEIVQDVMESVQKEQTSSNGRWVLRNTFIELVEDGSPANADGFSSNCLMRASSDSVLYEGYSPNQAPQEVETKAPQKPLPPVKDFKDFPSDEPIEFELNGWSDTETNPDTKEGEKSLPLPCYSHIKDFPSGESTPHTAQAAGHDDFDQYVARTPSPRGMDWPSGFGEAGQLPKEEDMRSDPMPGLAPPTHSRVSSSDVALDNKSASKQDLQRLAAEVARLAQENEFLRQRVMAQEQRKEESKSQGESQPAATTPVQQESNMGWATVLMPVSFGPGSGSGSMQDSADSWMGPHGPHSQELGQDSQQARRRRFRQKGDAEFEADLNLQKGRQVRGTAVPTKPVECDLPMEECTTVMLRNLPNNYTRAMLLAMLDSEGFEGKYNFLYLPIDFQSRACLGYAFVNLVDPSYVAQFWAKFSGYSKWVLPSKKVCGVSWSGPHQGLEAHVERYRNSPVARTRQQCLAFTKALI